MTNQHVSTNVFTTSLCYSIQPLMNFNTRFQPPGYSSINSSPSPGPRPPLLFFLSPIPLLFRAPKVGYLLVLTYSLPLAIRYCTWYSPPLVGDTKVTPDWWCGSLNSLDSDS